MKVKELLNTLSKYDLDNEVDVVFNADREWDESVDIACNIEIMGDTNTTPTIIVMPKTKSIKEFETIYELLQENGKTLKIEMTEEGIYVYLDDELRRELDLKEKNSLKVNSEEFIKKLIEIL